MAIDTRDWYKDRHNRRARYVERAAFRVGHGEALRRKRSAAWRRNFAALFAVVCALLVAQFFL